MMRPILIAAGFVAAMAGADAPAAEFAPYGTAKIDMHDLPPANVVYDVAYDDPQKLNFLHRLLKGIRTVSKENSVVVFHGPELRAFAKENYEKYQGIVDGMAELAKDGVEFKMCSVALKLAGFAPEDMHGFITVVPSGFPEVVYWQGKGYKYINPFPISARDVRYLDQPSLKKK